MKANFIKALEAAAVLVLVFVLPLFMILCGCYMITDEIPGPAWVPVFYIVLGFISYAAFVYNIIEAAE